MVMFMVVLVGAFHTAIGTVCDGATDDSSADISAWRVAAIAVIGMIRVAVTAVNKRKLSLLGIEKERLSLAIESHPDWRCRAIGWQ